MRAILIDSFRQKMEEIDLSTEVNEFQNEIRNFLRTDSPQTVHSNDLLTIIYDEDAHWKETPAFWSELMVEAPFFGNVICVGRNSISKEMEDLYRSYTFENFKVKWCSNEETIRYRAVVRQFAQNNRT